MKQPIITALTIIGILFGVPITLSAQTDVTEQYLTNAGFDDNSSWQSGNVATSATANSMEIAGWTLANSAAWSSSAAFGLGTDGQINGANIPATGADETSSGGCLGISTGWEGVCQYTQDVTLLPGKYRISYAAYNNLEGKTQSHNFIGFVPDNGTATYGIINNFIYQTWMTDEIIIELKETTSGKISVGLGAVSKGSGENAKVFIDYVKIEAWNASETLMPGNDVTPGSWTGNTGTYQNTYPEYYQGNHYTGDVMMSSTSVENGIYSADIFFHAHQAWISNVAADGTLNAYIKAENITRPTEIINNTEFADYEPKCYHIDDIIVSDDNLNMAVGNSAEGANWLTVKTKKITKMTTPYVSYGAFPLPTIAVTAGFWYQVDVPIGGTYTLNSSESATITYTQDGTRLTSETFSTTTGGNIELSAGKLYLKASTSTILSLTAASYSYNIGSATSDKAYVQPGQTVSINFAEAATNDPAANLTQDYGNITLAGNVLTTTPTAKGFTFIVPNLSAGGEYLLKIPAGAVSYSGHVASEAQELTLRTPAVFDGIYFLKTPQGHYLARGNNYGTRAITDDWGLPLHIATDNDNNSTLQYADTKLYLFNTGFSAYTDWNSDQGATSLFWTFSLNNGTYRLSSVLQDGKFTKQDANDNNVYTDGDGTSGTVIEWTIQTPAEHAAEMAAKKAALQTLEGSIANLSSKTYLTCNPTTTAEQYQGSGDILTGSIDITAPGIYKFSIQAFNRMASNDVTYPLHTAQADCPPVYAFFGDTKIQLASVFDEATTASTGYSIDGMNYPNGQGGALTAFKEGRYQNVIWLRVDENALGTYEYGITNQGAPGENSHWTCYAPDGIEITRYYNPAVDGLDEQDQLIASLRYTIGDVNEDRVITNGDVTPLVNIILGKTTEYKDYLADVNEDKNITIADVTALVNIILGKNEAKTIDMTYKYADLDAMIYAEQSATENNGGGNYMLESAVCTLTGDNVSAYYNNLQDYLTTLKISTSLQDVVSVSVYALGKENIAGPMTVNRSDENISYSYSAGSELTYANSQESDVITVSEASSGTTTAYLRPITLQQGVKVTIRTTDGKFYSQDFTSITAGQENTLTFTATNAQNLWMATIPGNTYFSMLSTPGAHDAATSSVTSYTSSAKCQNEDLAGLLANGVRAFDLRPGYYYNATITENNLYIYHGQVSTNVLYKDAIRIFAEFLQANPSESISIIMVKENNKPLLSSWADRSSEMWSVINAVHSTYGAYMKVLDHSYYTLDDFRGKMCYVNRTGTDCTNTVRITNWPDDDSVTDYSCAIGGTCYASVEDAYNASQTNKKTAVTQLLGLSSANTNRTRFHYTYTSIANSPASYAATMNPYTADYISNNISGPAGYVYGDYMGSQSNGGSALLNAIVAQNYKYVFKNRSRME